MAFFFGLVLLGCRSLRIGDPFLLRTQTLAKMGRHYNVNIPSILTTCMWTYVRKIVLRKDVSSESANGGKYRASDKSISDWRGLISLTGDRN